MKAEHDMEKRRIIAIVLALALALSALGGCGSARTDKEPDPVEGNLPGTELGVSDAADDIFSLNYNSSASLNPYATNDTNNLLISQLVYDNIFELDDDYNLTSRIITAYENTGGTYWTFTVDTSIKMHDGTNLTAADVAYSISRAKLSSRCSGRFTYTYGAGAISEDQFVVNLGKADTLFPYLLTVPVVKDGSAGESLPAGTGPYRYVEGADYVEAFEGHVNYQSLPVDRVYFKEYTEAEDIIMAFEDSYIDLQVTDPSGKTNYGYGGNTETRYYTTTNMHYFGFNATGEFVSNAQYRYALQLAVDREYAADTLMGNGAAASCLPVSPLSPWYDEELARELKFNLELCAMVFDNMGVTDRNGDGKREYVEYSREHEINIDLIVCSEAAGKGDIAKQFASDLAKIGVTVTVRELGWSDYQTALSTGEFDMYYAEVKLGADFDLTSLLTKDAQLNYGKIEDENYATYINDFLAADELTRDTAAKTLLDYIASTAVIIPVLFERQAVISHRNVITGMNPTSSNVFFGMENWTIKFSNESDKGEEQ